MNLVDLGRHPLSPPLGDDVHGLTVKIVCARAEGVLQVLLHGSYQVSVDDARVIGAIPLQRALIVTATKGYASAVMNLLGETLAFKDDEASAAGVVRGYFNTELMARAPDFPWDGARVFVSMGPLISNVERVELTA
jgi:hypothetical protein